MIEHFEDIKTIEVEEQSLILTAIQEGYLQPHYKKEGGMYLNPLGTVMRSEVISSLSTTNDRRDSVDRVSYATDFFNAGYNQLVPDEQSNLYNVYSREDLLRPIRRIELGYILAHYDNFDYADDFNYEGYLDKLYTFEDIKDLNLELPISEDLSNLIPSNYDSIEDYFNDLRKGTKLVPLSLLLLTVNLAQLLGDSNLQPLKGVSRVEFALILKGLGLIR